MRNLHLITHSSFDFDPLNIDSQEGITLSDSEDYMLLSSTPLVKTSASVKDETVDATDLLLVADDMGLLGLFKKDYTIHIYTEKKQLNRPKRGRRTKTFSPTESV